MAKRKPSRKAPPPKKKYEHPLVLYVIKGADNTFFGYGDFNGFDDGERVSVYDLREVRTVHVTRGLRAD